MNKKFYIILGVALAVVAGLVTLIILLIVGNNKAGDEALRSRQEADSLKMANEQILLTNEFDKINADFSAYENQQVYLKNDSLVVQYNEARDKIQRLLGELEKEKKNHKYDNARSKEKIRQLEAEISTLREIVKHYLAEIQRLGEENEGLRREIENVSARNQELSTQVTATSNANRELTQTVQLAKKLNITGISLRAYNKKDKPEKNVTKARKLGVSFTVSPNNTASPGKRDFYVRIISPEGSLLGGTGSFSYEGTTLQATMHRAYDYDNGELPVSIYWPVNTTLIPGDYTVEVFSGGYRLGSRRVTLTK